MPSPAEKLYPKGPSNALGNGAPSITSMTVPKGADPDEYERLVDEHIKKHKPQENDLIRVEHGDELKIYKYLGPNSGGRKDWMEVPQDPKAPTS
jgi:hypothetical protein